MVKKFNLSVPDELGEKIQARREELGSLSSIFQDAVSQTIQKNEDLEKRLKLDEDMEAIVARLRIEKEETETQYPDLGREAGLAWAKTAHYVDLDYAYSKLTDKFRDLSSNSPFKVSHAFSSIKRDAVLGKYFTRCFEADHRMLFTDSVSVSDVTLTFPKAFTMDWLMGWKEAVDLFYKEVISLLEEETPQEDED